MTSCALYGKIYLSHNFILLYRYGETISWQKMFLSFLLPLTVIRNCVTTMRDTYLQVRSL